jgi:hypothetical protein
LNEDLAVLNSPEVPSGNGGGIVFPFERDQDYPILQLLEFEADLLRVRQSDLDLSNRLRIPTDPEWRWIKLRHEELIPLQYCLEHHKFSRDGIFRIMPEGDSVDLRVRDGDVEMKLQITIADPVWGSSRKGSQHHIKVEWLNTGEIVNGFGPYRRTEEKVTGSDRMLSNEERDRAYGGGLTQALKRKSNKDGGDQILVIYCRDYSHVMDAASFQKLTECAIASCNIANFAHVWFVDSGEGFFVEF